MDDREMNDGGTYVLLGCDGNLVFYNLDEELVRKLMSKIHRKERGDEEPELRDRNPPEAEVLDFIPDVEDDYGPK